MNSMMSIINLLPMNNQLAELSAKRHPAAVPFGGKYRLIDFVLSGMVNAGIDNIGMLLPPQYRSLWDHVRTGTDWGLARKRDGLFWLPPTNRSAGEIDSLQAHLDYLRKSRQSYVLVTDCQSASRVDYREMLAFHRQKRADITVLYHSEAALGRQGQMAWGTIDADAKLLSCMSEAGGSSYPLLPTYLLRRELLMELVERCRQPEGTIAALVHTEASRRGVYGFRYSGYWAPLQSLSGYFQHSMALLNEAVRSRLFGQAGRLYTRGDVAAPVRYRPGCRVQNALVDNGCIIGGELCNSVVFGGATIATGAKVQHSILLPACRIDEGVELEFVICDKDVHITRGTKLRGTYEQPLVIAKGSVV